MRFAVPVFRFAFLLSAAPLTAGLSVYMDMPAAWKSATDREHTRAFGAGFEVSWTERFATVARARVFHVKQDYFSEEDRTDAFYALGEPKDFRIWEFQAAGRIYPWEWLPGFYTEALGGYKRAGGRNPDAAPGYSAYSVRTEPGIFSFETNAYGIGLGFGYRWTWGPSRIVLGFVFGPEWVYREGRDAQGGRVRSRDMGSDLMRLNTLELGLGF